VTTESGAKISAPEGTVIGKDGTVTIPAGKEAEITLPDVAEITVPGGSTIDKNGTVTVGAGTADISLPGGAAISLSSGSTVSADGDVRVGASGATVFIRFGKSGGTGDNAVSQNPDGSTSTADAYASLAGAPGELPGLTLKIAADTVILLDEKAPLGYSVASGHPFTDAKDSDRFGGDVTFAYAHGLFAGTGAESFSPNTARLMDIDLSKERQGAFADEAEISAWATDAVNAMYAAGILNGKGADRFDPKDKATRAEVAALLHRFIVAVSEGK
jgi:hypothetical protein